MIFNYMPKFITMKRRVISLTIIMVAAILFCTDLNARYFVAGHENNGSLFSNENNRSKYFPSLPASRVNNNHDHENPKGMYAGLFFGTSALNYQLDGSPVLISQIGYQRGDDSVVIMVPDGVDAIVSPSSDNQKLNLDAGFWLGYFPGFLTFEIADDKTLAFGAMTLLGLSFNGGFGGWLGIGPEVMFASGRLSFNAGYSFGWTGQQRNLGNLQLDGAQQIIIQSSSLSGCTAEDFQSESPFCRMHNQDSEFYVIGSSMTQSVYARFGFTFSESSGVALVLGYRQMRSSNISYELWGPYRKTANEDRSPLPGPEMDGLSSAFGFDGLFFQIELFNKPF